MVEGRSQYAFLPEIDNHFQHGGFANAVVLTQQKPSHSPFEYILIREHYHENITLTSQATRRKRFLLHCEYVFPVQGMDDFPCFAQGVEYNASSEIAFRLMCSTVRPRKKSNSMLLASLSSGSVSNASPVNTNAGYGHSRKSLRPCSQLTSMDTTQESRTEEVRLGPRV